MKKMPGRKQKSYNFGYAWREKLKKGQQSTEQGKRCHQNHTQNQSQSQDQDQNQNHKFQPENKPWLHALRLGKQKPLMKRSRIAVATV